MLYDHYLRKLAEHYNFSLTTAWRKLPEKIRHVLLYGSGDEEIAFDYWMKGKMHPWRKPFEGVIPNLVRQAEGSARCRLTPRRILSAIWN